MAIKPSKEVKITKEITTNGLGMQTMQKRSGENS
jgi:hypothetical protein